MMIIQTRRPLGQSEAQVGLLRSHLLDLHRRHLNLLRILLHLLLECLDPLTHQMHLFQMVHLQELAHISPQDPK